MSLSNGVAAPPRRRPHSHGAAASLPALFVTVAQGQSFPVKTLQNTDGVAPEALYYARTLYFGSLASDNT